MATTSTPNLVFQHCADLEEDVATLDSYTDMLMQLSISAADESLEAAMSQLARDAKDKVRSIESRRREIFKLLIPNAPENTKPDQVQR